MLWCGFPAHQKNDPVKPLGANARLKRRRAQQAGAGRQALVIGGGDRKTIPVGPFAVIIAGVFKSDLLSQLNQFIPETPAAPEPAAAKAAAPAAPATPAAPVAAAGASPFHRLPNPAKTSGGYTADEIAELREKAYARYKARKGADAKELH